MIHEPENIMPFMHDVEKKAKYYFKNLRPGTWGLAEASNLIKKETLAQVFSCESWEISNNTFLTESLRATASI